ncbi:MAG TPA: carboxypeptidase-like regulatory domain-containing protein, partial [Terriglobia bacterium]|nr:carboxypeptidase-like regulatory domain-containing protein [Terriglobia bacterium]
MRRVSWLALFSLLFVSLPSSAQKFTATLTGRVTDPTGAMVAGANVKVTSKATGATRTAVTNADGSFTFPELSPDTYNVSVSKSGFKEVVQQNVALHVADNLSLEIHLPIGSVGETVTVEGTPSEVAVQTQSGEVSNTMLGQQVRELPLNGRNFVQLTTLVPGAAVGESFDNKN